MTERVRATALLIGLMLVVAPGCEQPRDDDTGTPDDDVADDDATGGGDDDTTAGSDDDTAEAECGNGVVEVGEACDDGNTLPDDGCSEDCSVKRIVVSLGVEGSNYDLGRDAAGNVYLLFKHGNALHLGRIEEQQLVAVEAIPDTGGVSVRYTRPRLAVRPDGGSVHTAWISGTPGHEIFHTWWDADGWHRETAWSNGGAEAWAAVPSVGVDLQGAVHVIAQKWWYDGESQDESSVLYVHKPPGGVWSAEATLHFESGRNWRDTSLFTDLAGGVHGTWKSLARPGQYRYTASGDSMSDHSSLEIPIPEAETTLSFGDSFVTADGGVHHAAFAYPGGTQAWSVKPAGAEEFGASEILATTDNDEHMGYENPWPAVGVDVRGRVFVAWAENRGGSSVPYVVLAQYGGEAWSREDLATDADMEANSKPAMTVVDDDVFIVWRDGSGEMMLAELACVP
jgi:cysteine-rich repeat protein